MATGPKRRPTIERLLARVEIDAGGCWLWTGSTNKGQGQIGSGGQGRPIGVHVAAWLHYHGPIPQDRKVSQACGRRTCCNPDHLELRTQSQVVRSWKRPQPPRPKQPKSPRLRPSPIERLLARIEIGPEQPGVDGGCWLWPGSAVEAGYGRIAIASRPVATHRFVFEFYNGWAPPELDHLCNVPACCNPDHLEPVTHDENVRRAKERGSYRAWRVA